MEPAPTKPVEKNIFARFCRSILKPPAVRAYADLIERDRVRKEEKEARRIAEGEI